MKTLIEWFVSLLLAGALMGQSGNDSPESKAAAIPSPDAPTQLTLQLSDGSRITGTTAIDHLNMKTQYATMQVPFLRVRTYQFESANHTAHVSLDNGDELTGQVQETTLEVKTVMGRIMVPLAKVRQIRVGGSFMPDGLVLHYTFDKDEGERATDSSGAGNHGKVKGAAYTSEGKIFGAMRFSGDGDAVIVGNPESLHLKDFTIMAWIKRDDLEKVSKTTEYGEIFGYGHGGYVFGIEQEGYVYLSQADIHIGSISSFQIHDKDFHHVAVTKDGSKFVFYLDGVAYPAEDYETEGDFEFSTDAAVGARSDDLTKCFFGVIDDVAVFKRPLSADEVKKVYDSQK